MNFNIFKKLNLMTALAVNLKRIVILRDAIFTAHAGKYRTLQVNHYSNCSIWNSKEDKFWNKYKKARYEISKHKFIEKLLKSIKAI